MDKAILIVFKKEIRQSFSDDDFIQFCLQHQLCKKDFLSSVKMASVYALDETQKIITDKIVLNEKIKNILMDNRVDVAMMDEKLTLE